MPSVPSIVMVIFVVLGLISMAIALRNVMAALRKKPYPAVSAHVERLKKYVMLLLVPLGLYELLLEFRRGDLSVRFLIAILVFCVIIGLSAKTWGSDQSTASSGS